MLKAVFVFGLMSTSAVVQANDVSLRCYSYGNAESGIEIEISEVNGALSATFYQNLLGRLIPAPIGVVNHRMDPSGEHVYTQHGRSELTDSFELTIWPDDIRTMTVNYPRSKSWTGSFAKARIQFKDQEADEPELVCIEGR